jgi:hypothetical protein
VAAISTSVRAAVVVRQSVVDGGVAGVKPAHDVEIDAAALHSRAAALDHHVNIGPSGLE